MEKNRYENVERLFKTLPPNTFEGHALIAGSTGTKMFYTTVFQLKSILKEKRQKVVVFESGMNEQSYVESFEDYQDKKCLSFFDENGVLNFNILRVPYSIRPIQWLQCLTESIVLGYSLGQKAYDILYKKINGLYTTFGVYQNSSKSDNIKVSDLINSISKDSDAKQSFAYEEVKTSLLQILQSLVSDYTNDAIPNEIVLHAKKGSLFIVDSFYASKEAQNVLSTLFLKSISEAHFNFKKENKQKEKTVFFFDELRDIAQSHFKKDTTQSTYIEQVFIHGRSFDIEIMGKTNSIHVIPHYMIANARTLIFHRTISLEQLHFLENHEKNAISKLEDDEFILYRFGKVHYARFDQKPFSGK